jgi:hypothetical protein
MSALGSPQEATSLPLFTRVPDNCCAMKVRRHHVGSVYRKGMFVVIDPDGTELEHGVDYAVQWDSSRYPGVVGLRNINGEWFVGPAGGGHSQLIGDGAIALVDGPYQPHRLRKRLAGRVIGYLGGKDGRPLRELWDEDLGGRTSTEVMEPDDLPEVYSCRAKGTCLEPVFKDGTRFCFNRLEQASVGDYVGLWRKSYLTTQGQLQVMLKRLVSELPRVTLPLPDEMPMSPVVLVEAHNPPETFVVPLDKLMAVHKCNGAYEGEFYPVSREESRAIAAQQRAERERVA